MRIQALVLAAAAALGTASLQPAPEAAIPAAGPGGVIHAIQDLVTAVDARDTEKLDRLLAKQPPGAYFGFEDGGEFTTFPDAPTSFFDVASTGGAVDQRGIRGLSKKIATDLGGENMRTEVHSIHADCPSARCSFAVVEFDRIHGTGDDQVVMPMRATALLVHEKGGFRIFHWHAARRAAD